MKYIAVLFLSTIIHSQMAAQQKAPGGEYDLRGVMEVGSGFQINADHSFDFFYAYGAIDREAHGTWTLRGDSIILNTAKKPPRDYKLEVAKKINNNGVTIKIRGDNKIILKNVFAAIHSGDSLYRNVADDYGLIHFGKFKVDKISLIHEFWPDRFSVFTISDPTANYFEFSIEKWIVDVEFDNFVLLLTDSTLTGGHPLLPKKQYQYTKAQ